MSKVWFVTGASSGIGQAIVLAALTAGDRVVATSRNLKKLTSAFTSSSRESLLLLELDVRDEEATKRAVSEAVKTFGSIDVLVNNAGYCLMGTMESYSIAQIAHQMETNFLGVVHMLYAVLPHMRKQKSERIFNISSVAGVVGIAGCSAYAASKHAIEGLSLSLAEEVRAFGIDITLIEPGFFRTDLLGADSAIFGKTSVDGYQDPLSLRSYGQAITARSRVTPTILLKFF